MHHGLVALALALGGCGDYVDYDGAPPAAVETVGADALDEQTRAAFADATSLDHLALEGILARFVSSGPDGYFTYVDYEALGASPEARLALTQYMATLDLVHPDQLESSAERLAYWLNAYNAGVLFGVLDVWGGDPTYRVTNAALIFFDRPGYKFAGQTLTLNQIEHVIIRGDFENNAFDNTEAEQKDALRSLHASLWADTPIDARIHVAVNCASLGCPNLPAMSPYAYRADLLEAQLTTAAVTFANNPGKGAGPNGISQLFNWYEVDWVRSYGSPKAFLEAHRDSLDGVALDKFIVYDWTLNAVQNKP